MSRDSFLAMLAAYRPAAQEEKKTLLTFIEFVRSTPDCFKREMLLGHVTASAWVLNPAGDKALLTHHKKLGRWLQPGGHVDGSPDVAEAALREAQEESGISALIFISPDIFDLDIHEIPEHAGIPAHLHYDVRFLLHSPRTETCVVSAESHELAWVSARDIDYIKTDASVLRLRDKWVARMPFLQKRK